MIPFWGTTKNDKATKSQKRMFHKGLSKLADKIANSLKGLSSMLYDKEI